MVFVLRNKTIAAMGGEHALNSIDSMYAMGKENESLLVTATYAFIIFFLLSHC